MQDTVVLAIQEAYSLNSQQIQPKLLEDSGRVYGSVVVKDSEEFNNDSGAIRSRKMWEKLRRLAGTNAGKIGVILLFNEQEASEFAGSAL